MSLIYQYKYFLIIVHFQVDIIVIFNGIQLLFFIVP